MGRRLAFGLRSRGGGPGSICSPHRPREAGGQPPPPTGSGLETPGSSQKHASLLTGEAGSDRPGALPCPGAQLGLEPELVQVRELGESEKGGPVRAGFLVEVLPEEVAWGTLRRLPARLSSSFSLCPLPTAERKEWIQALQQAVAEQRARARLSSAYPLGAGGSEPPDRAGSLELRGFKNKLYVAVVGDKVQLYKNLEVRLVEQAAKPLLCPSDPCTPLAAHLVPQPRPFSSPLPRPSPLPAPIPASSSDPLSCLVPRH